MAGRFPRPQSSVVQRGARFLVRPHRSALRRSLSSLLHPWRLFSRSVQQTQRHHLHQTLRVLRHVPCHVCPCRQPPRHRGRRALPRLHPGRNLRAHQIRPSARTPSPLKTQLGQRHHRTHHAPRRHHRCPRRRLSRANLSWPPVLLRIHLPRTHHPRPVRFL